MWPFFESLSFCTWVQSEHVIRYDKNFGPNGQNDMSHYEGLAAAKKAAAKAMSVPIQKRRDLFDSKMKF